MPFIIIFSTLSFPIAAASVRCGPAVRKLIYLLHHSCPVCPYSAKYCVSYVLLHTRAIMYWHHALHTVWSFVVGCLLKAHSNYCAAVKTATRGPTIDGRRCWPVSRARFSRVHIIVCLVHSGVVARGHVSASVSQDRRSHLYGRHLR